MKDARTLLDGLFGSLGGGQGSANQPGQPDGLLGQARGAWDRQGGMTKGAIAGGLLAVLMGKDTRRLAGTALKVGGAALVGGLAWKAWQDWQAGKEPAHTPTALPPGEVPVALPPPPPGSAFQPAGADEADELATRLVQAMVAAAKADGHVTTRERARIDAQLAELDLGAEAQALVVAELDAPLDAGRIAGLARGPEEAAEIYAASLLVVDPEAPAEKGYLAMLAARLALDPALVSHLHARAATLA